MTTAGEQHDLSKMPEMRSLTTAVVLHNKYLVLIGGHDEEKVVIAGCFIYDFWSNCWSSTPTAATASSSCTDMIDACGGHTAAVLDGKIVVAGGEDSDYEAIS